MKLTKQRLKEIIKEELKEGSLDWEKNFPWAKGNELKVIAKAINMTRRGIDGILAVEKDNPNVFKQWVKSAARRGLGEAIRRLKEGRKFKYKKNDWKKYNQLVKRGKSVMIQTSYGDEFAWEDGSSHGVFGTESDGREIEIDHNDIDQVEVF